MMNKKSEAINPNEISDRVKQIGPSEIAEYQRVLETSFPAYPFALQTMSRVRFRLFERLVRAAGLPPNAQMLSVGCGAFALEVLSDLTRASNVTAFDYTPEFQAVYEGLCKSGLLGRVEFSVADARSVSYPLDSFDIAVFHDIFYETALDAPEIIARFVPNVRPNGLVYFDLMDRRAHGIWQMIGAERPEYKRYDIDDALSRIQASGLEIIDKVPTDENRKGLKRATITTIRLATGIANAYGVLARRKA